MSSDDASIQRGYLIARLLSGPMSRDDMILWTESGERLDALVDLIVDGTVERGDEGDLRLRPAARDELLGRVLRELGEDVDPAAEQPSP